MKDFSVASKPRNLLTLVGVVFIGTLAIPDLYSRFLHNQSSDPDFDCGRLLGLMVATPQYKERLCRRQTHEIADPGGGCLYRYYGAPRTGWQIPQQPLCES